MSVRAAEVLTRGNLRCLGKLVGGRWPHLSAEDCEVWSRWLGVCPLKGVEWVYDVRVGRYSAVGVGAGGSGEPDYRELLAKRVDVVGLGDGVWWVVEVKPVAGMSALGQVLTYVALVRELPQAPGWVRGAVVCERVDDDVRGVFEDYGVVVWAVPVGCSEAVLEVPGAPW